MPIQVQIEGRGDLELEFPDDTPREVIDRVVKEHVTGKRDSSGMPTSTVQAAQNANGQRQTTQVTKPVPVEPPLPSLRDVLDRSKPLPKSLEQPPPSVLFGSAEKPTFLRSIFSQPLTPDNKQLPTVEELNVRAKHDAAVPPMWKVGSGIDKENKSPSEVLDQGLQFENLGVSQALRNVTDRSESPFLQNVGKAATGVAAGVEDLATGLTTPSNIALVGGAAKLAKAAPTAARGLSGLFALDMAGGFVDSAKQLAQAMETGDVEGMARAGVHGAGSALFGTGALRHLAGKPVLPKLPKTEPPLPPNPNAVELGKPGVGGPPRPVAETVKPAPTDVPEPAIKPVVEQPRPADLKTSMETAGAVRQRSKLTPPEPPPEAYIESPVEAVPEVKAKSGETIYDFERGVKREPVPPDPEVHETIYTEKPIQKAESKPVPTDTDTVDTYIDRVAEPYQRHLQEIPKTPSPNPSSDIYLGSGFGSFQSLLNSATAGKLSNGARKAIGKVRNKLQSTADTVTREVGDHTLPVRDLSEMAGITDPNVSPWVAFRMQAGNIGAALGWINDMAALTKQHNQELWNRHKQVTSNRRKVGQDKSSPWSPLTIKRDRADRMQLLDLSKEWAQTQTLIEDIAPSKPDYIFPKFKDSRPEDVGTLADVIRRKEAIEKEVGPEMVEVFRKQQVEYLSKYRQILHDILVDPYWRKDDGGKPVKGIGLMSEEQFNKMIGTRPNYISVQHAIDPIELQTYGTGGRMSVPANTATKSLKEGSTAELMNPIVALNNELTRTIILAHKNDAAMKLADVAKVPGMEDYIKKVWPGYKPKVINGKPTEVVFNVIRDGKKETYFAPEELRVAIDRLDRHSFDVLTESMAAANELYRAGITMSPRFVTNNLARDFFTAFITDPNPHGFYLLSYMNGLVHGLTKGISKGGLDVEYNNYLKHFGGGAGVKEYLTGSTSQKAIDRTMQDYNPTIAQQANVPGKLWRGWQYLGEATEVGPRLMAARNARKAGESQYVQGWRGRNITVDFATHGAAQWVAASRKLLPFVNARLQGTRNMMNVVGESMKELPGLKQGLRKMGVAPTRSTKAQRQHVATGFGVLGALTMATTIWNMVAFPEEYNQVSDYEKNEKLQVMTGERDKNGQFITEINFPIQDVAWFVELIRGSMYYLANHHTDAFRELVKKFYPNMPEELIKFDWKKTAANAVGSILPINITKGGEFSTEAIAESLQIPLMSSLYTAATGHDVRHGKEADQGIPGQRRNRENQYTSPSAWWLSRGINKAMDATGVFSEDTPLRSAPVVEAAVNQAAGPLWFKAGDSIIKGINKQFTPSDATRPLIHDPQAEFGGGKEKPGLWESALVNNFFRARPGTDSEEVRKRMDAIGKAGNTTLEVGNTARAAYTFLKAGDRDKATKVIQQAQSTFTNPADKEAFYDKIANLLTMDQINADIKQYNTTSKYKIPEMSEADARFARADVDARAMYILDGIQSRTSPDARAKFIEEMKVKKILNKNVYGALGRIIEQQQQTTTTAP